MARKPGGAASAATAAPANDDIGEAKRLEMYRLQVTIRQAEQRANDLFFANLIKGTSHLSLGQGSDRRGRRGGDEAGRPQLLHLPRATPTPWPAACRWRRCWAS